MRRNKRPCTALCKDGTPCRNWAVRGIRAARCAMHGGKGPVTVAARHMAHLRPAAADGLPENGEAHGGRAPRHVAELMQARPLTGVILDEELAPSHYAVHYSDAELALFQAGLQKLTLQAELGLVRIALHRLLPDFTPQGGLSASKMNERAITLFRGVDLVARLLTVQQAMGEGKSPGEKAIDIALRELAEELDL